MTAKREVSAILGLTFFLPLGTANSPASLTPCTACVCIDDRDFAGRVDGTPAIFVGTVIDARYFEESGSGYTFVLEKSWKGPVADTIFVRNTGKVCEPFYVVGGTYLVFADSIARGLTVPGCADPIFLSSATDKLTALDSLIGRPRSPDKKSLDNLVSNTLVRQQTSAVQPYITIHVRTRQLSGISGVTVELLGTDLSAVTNPGGRVVFRRIALGWHRVRLTFAGIPEDHYIRLRCWGNSLSDGEKDCFIVDTTLIPRTL